MPLHPSLLMNNALTYPVYDESKDKERRRDSEDCAVLRGARRRIAHTDLHDKGRHRLDRLGGVEAEIGLLTRSDRHNHGFPNRPREG